MDLHPFCQLFPEMEPAGFDALKQDIKLHGQHEPVILHEGKILDGRHRWKACEELGMECRTSEFKGRDALAFVTGANLHRRHLSDSQRAMIAARLANLRLGSNQHREGPPNEGPSVSRAQAAEILDVGLSSVDRARAIIRKADPELIKKIDSGKITVGAAERMIRISHARQNAVLPDGEEETVRDVRESPPEKAAETKPQEPPHKVPLHTKPSATAANIWLEARSILDRIPADDTRREKVLREVIRYAQERISAGK